MIGTGAFWQTLRTSIKMQRAEWVRAVISSGLSEKEYRELVGKIQALDWVIGHAAEILGDRPKEQRNQEEMEEI